MCHYTNHWFICEGDFSSAPCKELAYLIGSSPFSLLGEFTQYVTFSYRKLLVCGYNPSAGQIHFSFYD